MLDTRSLEVAPSSATSCLVLATSARTLGAQSALTDTKASRVIANSAVKCLEIFAAAATESLAQLVAMMPYSSTVFVLKAARRHLAQAAWNALARHAHVP